MKKHKKILKKEKKKYGKPLNGIEIKLKNKKSKNKNSKINSHNNTNTNANMNTNISTLSNKRTKGIYSKQKK